MKFRLGLLLVSSVLTLTAQTQMNVSQLVDFIRSTVALHQQSDKQVANYLRKDVTLSERLTDKTINDLAAQGAGEKTVEALRLLRDRSASLRPTDSADLTHSLATAPDNTLKAGPATASIGVKAAQPPPPNSVQQQQILDSMRQYAMSYTSGLPNYVCVRVDRRFVDPRGNDSYQSVGTLLSKVTYHNGEENYKVYSDSGRIVDPELGGIGGGGGARSSGEFAGMLRSIFDPKSDAEFGWDHWAAIRGRTMAVFNYFIDSGHSSFHIDYGNGPGDDQTIITAYKGLVYADANTGEVDRITFNAVNIPSSFPVRTATDVIDYDLVDIGGDKSVLPIRALLNMSTSLHQSSRNEIEFRNYHEYGAQSVIKYDTDPNAPPPPPMSKNQTEEQPVTAAPEIKPKTPGQQKPAPDSKSPWTLPTPPPPPPQ